MRTLNWRHTDWSARKFIFSIEQEIIGQLTFYSSWNCNAVYTDKETKLKFIQKSFWDGDVSVTQDDKLIGEIDSGLFGKQTLRLVTGEKFILSSNFWGRDVNWKTEKGETVIEFEQATMMSMGKGLISLKDSLTIETQKILISSGLFIRQLILKRVLLTVAIVVPVLAVSRR